MSSGLAFVSSCWGYGVAPKEPESADSKAIALAAKGMSMADDARRSERDTISATERWWFVGMVLAMAAAPVESAFCLAIGQTTNDLGCSPKLALY